MSEAVLSELTRHGGLRAGINLGNFLLVTGKSPDGAPEGVAPDMARAIAERLGVDITLVGFARPGDLADAVDADAWDIGLIGAEPERAEKIAFTPAYVEIEATFLLPAGSTVTDFAELDRPGVRIAVSGRSAYDLWLQRHFHQAELVGCESVDASYDEFVRSGCDALAGLRPRLLDDVRKLPGSTVMAGRFTAVQQAIGTAKANTAAIRFLHDFVEEAKASGFVASLIAKHKVNGLSVAA
jgi:polar amino acid transport system substrate-binding protein